MSEEINKIFKEWKQFLSWCYENNDKTTEIHRDDLERVMAYTRQLENIIKEVREYIESYINQFNGVYPPVDMRYLDLNKVLKILDKEGK